jgi:uncharacterized protein DUF5335
MATTVQIPQAQLAQYFKTVTKAILPAGQPEAVDLELVSLDWGDQVGLQGAHLIGITYDPHTNSLEFEIDPGDHRIFHPKEVWVLEEDDGFPRSIEIVQPDGARQIATIRRVGLQPVDVPRSAR